MAKKKPQDIDDHASMTLQIEKKRSSDYMRERDEARRKLDARGAELKEMRERLERERLEYAQERSEAAQQLQRLSFEREQERELVAAQLAALEAERKQLEAQHLDRAEQDALFAERERRAPELIARCTEAEQRLQRLQRELDRGQQELARIRSSVEEEKALIDAELQQIAEREAQALKREQAVSRRESTAGLNDKRLTQLAQGLEQREAACVEREEQAARELAAAREEGTAAAVAQRDREAREADLLMKEQHAQLCERVMDARETARAAAETELQSLRGQLAKETSQLAVARAELGSESAALKLVQERWQAEAAARERQAEAAEHNARAGALIEAKKRCDDLEARARAQYEAHIEAAQQRARDLEAAAQSKHDELIARALDEDRRQREAFAADRAEQEAECKAECARRLQRASEEAARIEAQANAVRCEAEKRAAELLQQTEAARCKEREQEHATAELESLRSTAERRQKRLDEHIKAEAAAAVQPLQAELAAREMRIQALEEKLRDETQKRQELDLLVTGSGNETVPKLRKRLAETQDRIRELEHQLRDRPSEEETARLRERADQVDAKERAAAEMRLQIARLENLRSRSEASQITYQGERAIAETLRATNLALRQELDHLKGLVDQRVSNPLLAFQEVRKNTQQPSGQLVAPKELRELMQRVRHRMASLPEGRARFYSEQVVATFIAALHSTRTVLLEGLSGTGKTSLPIAFAQAIGAGYDVIEVQSQWRDRGDLVGSYNPFHKRFNAQPFALALYKAGLPGFRERPFFIILDELNLSHVEHYFADILSMLQRERTDHRLRLADDPEALVHSPFTEGLVTDPRYGLALEIPPNVWFVGTANRDESTRPISDKVYDRSITIELNQRAETFVVDRRLELLDPIGFEDLNALFKKAPGLPAEAKRPVSDFLDATARELERRFRITRTNRFEDQWQRFLPVYLAARADGTQAGCTQRMGEALDHFLASKLLRPLKERFEPNLEEVMKELRDVALEKSWKKELWGPFPRTRSFVLLDEEISKRVTSGYAA